MKPWVSVKRKNMDEDMIRAARSIIFAMLVTSAVGNMPSQQDRNAILSYHIKVRKEVHPTAANMQYMVSAC